MSHRYGQSRAQGFEHAILEGNVKVIIDIMMDSSNMPNLDFLQMVDYIRSLVHCDSNYNLLFMWIYRDKNKVAHYLVKWAFKCKLFGVVKALALTNKEVY